MKTCNLKRLGLSLLITGLMVTGCGGSRDNVTSGTNGSGGGGNGNQFGTPSIQYDVTLNGPQGANPEFVTDPVDTDSILKVRIAPRPASPITVPGYGFTAEYGCAQFEIAVRFEGETEESTYQTPVLKVAGGNNEACPNAPESTVVDFSYFLGGNLPVELIVRKARNDFYCQLWNSTYNSAYQYYIAYLQNAQLAQLYATQSADQAAGYKAQVCPTKTAYSTHVMNAELLLQINGTNSVD